MMCKVGVFLSILSASLVLNVDASILRQVADRIVSQPAATNADGDFDKFMEEWFDEFMVRKPMEALRFGRQLPTCKGLKSSRVHQIWGDASAASETAGIQKDRQWLKKMSDRFGDSIGARDLSDERHVSYILMQKKVEEMHQENKYRAFRPPFGPLGCQVGTMGCQVQTAGMVKGLSIETVDDARCYVALLNGLPDFLLEHGHRLQEAASQGAAPYRLVVEAVVKDCDARLLIKEPRSHEFFQVFEGKLKKAKGISDKDRQALMNDAEKGIVFGVWPAYSGLRLIAQGLLPTSLASDKGRHSTDAHEFYGHRVQLLGVGGDAPSLHARALKLVDENAKEIQRNAGLVLPNLTSSTPALVMKALQKPYEDARYVNSDAGRDLYIKDVQGYIDGMWKSLQQSTGTKSGRLFYATDIPALPCVVKRIQSATFPGLAQYSPGSFGQVNHSATVGFNVYDMGQVFKMDTEILAYHEVVPGHHLQVTKTLTSPLPSFRRFFGDEAFAEGWAVYAEQDVSPRLVHLSVQAQLGRLNRLQLLAVRMAVDTGLHGLDWDRKKAEAFYLEHLMITPERAKLAVDRHFAWPAQQINYAAGHQELRRVRQAVASKQGLVKSLGKDWEAKLHSAILSHGDLPLAMLEQVVFAQLNKWRGQSLVQSHLRSR